MKRVLQSSIFWLTFWITGVLTALAFGWEANLFAPTLPGPPRPPVTPMELWFTIGIVLLVAFVSGLYAWRRKKGSCPTGVKRATGVGAVFGVITLLCPVCSVIPITLLGTSITLGFLAPFLPLLRFITLAILLTVAWVLWPATPSKRHG